MLEKDRNLARPGTLRLTFELVPECSAAANQKQIVESGFLCVIERLDKGAVDCFVQLAARVSGNPGECRERRQLETAPHEFLEHHVDDVRQLCFGPGRIGRHPRQPIIRCAGSGLDAHVFAQDFLVPGFAARAVVAREGCAR
ncbi:hypothetical protein WK43_09565 [Burkholderia ubonensis]|nr:hypothetical protein WK38_03420 [Burkholderia ubonensis]KVS48038.1 hypothetical protein WK37_08350 [Burkholderia ubonensis]KVS78771.1 hypothetical protein WK42_16080 [Burkholderia ubonensis]KVS93428.1 hypothetical protein WK44_11065 [Burkholderia ubonensis]KVS94173.1 hypothetical protein WK43_09565 [Burkholderia ubonensis]